MKCSQTSRRFGQETGKISQESAPNFAHQREPITFSSPLNLDAGILPQPENLPTAQSVKRQNGGKRVLIFQWKDHTGVNRGFKKIDGWTQTEAA